MTSLTLKAFDQGIGSQAGWAFCLARHSVPVLAKIDVWLTGQSDFPEVLPRGPLGQAITYARNPWAALCRYTSQGFLNIDNNAAERALKRVAIGRKNWLFRTRCRRASRRSAVFPHRQRRASRR